VKRRSLSKPKNKSPHVEERKTEEIQALSQKLAVMSLVLLKKNNSV